MRGHRMWYGLYDDSVRGIAQVVQQGAVFAGQAYALLSLVCAGLAGNGSAGNITEQLRAQGPDIPLADVHFSVSNASTGGACQDF